jgi:hypothetical protein
MAIALVKCPKFRPLLLLEKTCRKMMTEEEEEGIWVRVRVRVRVSSVCTGIILC